MKLSIVIPVLDSHEIVKRQVHYLSRFLNVQMEIIFVDDGSYPPLNNKLLGSYGIRLLKTNDPSPWSEHMATNIGIQDAIGEYIFKTDIDHIITREAVAEALNIKDNILLRFRRKPARLNELGEIIDMGEEIKSHSNTMVFRKDSFEKIGGYNEYGRGLGCGGSYDFRCRMGMWGVKEVMSNNFIYVWPNSPIKPTEDQHLFHNLRKTL